MKEGCKYVAHGSTGKGNDQVARRAHSPLVRAGLLDFLESKQLGWNDDDSTGCTIDRTLTKGRGAGRGAGAIRAEHVLAGGGDGVRGPVAYP